MNEINPSIPQPDPDPLAYRCVCTWAEHYLAQRPPVSATPVPPGRKRPDRDARSREHVRVIPLDEVYRAIGAEIERQSALKARGKFPTIPSDPEMSDGQFALVLVEELGEAAQALLKGDRAHAREELVQCAAVIVSRLLRADDGGAR